MQKTAPIFITFIFILCFSTSTFGGTSGKIMGKITDAETTEPLIGANITIAGTTMGAAADREGYFSIINVPPGIYELRASMMGYQTKTIAQVTVNIDLTTTMNIQLASTVLDMDAVVSVVAERPLVQMDMTSSLASIGTEEIDALPVETVTDVLEMQAGIVRTGDDLHIRGGRAGEVAFWVDGISTTEFYDGRMGINVENASIQQLQVVSGTFNAEYGQAMSGIVNIITKEGGQDYSGEMKGYVGDYVTNRRHYEVLERVDVEPDPQTGINKSTGVSENPLKEFNPIYNLELSLSGPIPFTGNRLSFFLNGRSFAEEGYLYGRNWFTPQGNPGDSSLVPMNPYWRNSGQVKLTWRATPDIKLSYNVFLNKWKNDRTYSHSQRYSPYGIPQQFGNAMTHIVSLNHVLSNNTFYEFKINRFLNEYESYVYEDPLATVKYLVRVPEDEELGIDAYSFDPSTTEGKAELKKLVEQRIPFEYFPDPNGPDGYVEPSYDNVPTSYSFQNGGVNREHQKRTSSYWIAKFDLTSQMSRKNQIKAGVEARLHEIDIQNFSVQEKINDEGRPIFPFEPMVPQTSSIHWDGMVRKPREFSAYVQDKLELSDFIVNLGLRFDYFDANATIPSDPNDPNIYFPFKNKNKYKNWQEPPSNLSPQERDEYIKQFTEYTPEERRAFMHKENEPKMAINPRLGIAYPITDRGVIHFSYGHFFQVPNFTYLYQNPDYKLSAGG
ncbi:TonB-dependent receptor, partial [candidate division KSB1 bacterium]|nr:TonB-dependent receptor [candidate division KSB1 bacterium]